MTKVIGLPGSPLRKLADEYDEKLRERELVIEEQKTLLDRQRIEMETLKGSGDMLRMQLADLATKLGHLADQIATAQKNVEGLRKKIPDWSPQHGSE